MNKPQLTISLLISNRLDTIPQCLDSLRPIMDAIPSELILIDTSKNSEVRELLLRYTDKVYEFEWCRDFAKARNEGIKRASGEWFLYLDDDEWFEEVDEIINFFKSGEYKEYAYANYIQRNFMDVKYINYSDCWVSRMVRLDKDIRFVSKIHEYFAPVNGRRKDLHVIANHSGYIYDTKEKREAHFERNYPLLLEMIEEEPTNIRWRLQLIQEFGSVAKWEELTEYSEQCLDLLKHTDTDYIRNHISTIYEGICLGLFRQEKYEECLQMCKKALEDKRSREVLKAMMYLKQAECQLHLEDFDEAIENVHRYLEVVHSTDRKNTAIIEQECALLVGDILEESKQKIAYSIMISCALEKGDISVLVKDYEKLCWSQEVIYSISNIENYMIKAMWTMPYHSIFVRVMLDVFCNKDLRAHFRKAILENEITSVNEFQVCLYDLVNAMQVVIDGPIDNDLLSYHQSLHQYVQAICQWYDFVETQGTPGERRDEVPGYLQAAMDISDYLELETSDTIQALGKLKNAVEALPDIADGMGRFLHNYSDLEKQRAEKQMNEMETLRIQVIEQVKSMLAAGQTDAAIQIIGQLKQMFPEDLEVSELALEVRINKK